MNLPREYPRSDFAVALGAAALILGAIGLVRAVAEFGAPGIAAFVRLVLAPAALVVGNFLLSPARYEGKFPSSLLPSNDAVRVILFLLMIFTGVAFALSAAFGVAWLMPK